MLFSKELQNVGQGHRIIDTMPPNLQIFQADSNTVSFTLSGLWEGELSDQQRRTFEEKACVLNGTVSLVPGDLFQWDQHLAIFIYHLAHQLAANDTILDISAMPKSLQDIVALANAVPPNRTGKAAKKFTFTPFVKTVSNFFDSLVFLGEMTLSVLRLFTFRSHMRTTDAVSAFRQAGHRPSVLSP